MAFSSFTKFPFARQPTPPDKSTLRTGRANSLPDINVYYPARSSRNLLAKQPLGETPIEDRPESPSSSVENPMKPMLAQMLRKSKGKVLSSHLRLQRVFIPPSVKEFDTRLREDPEILGRFLLWYLYHDIYKLPESPDEWFGILPAEEIKGWLRLSNFIRLQSDDDLPWMRAICSSCAMPLDHVRAIVTRAGQPDRMGWTEIMEIQRWGHEMRKPDIQITTAIEEKLLNDRLVCDGLKDMFETDSLWHTIREQIVCMIDSYLLDIIFPFLQLAKKEKGGILKRWLADNSNTDVRAAVHVHWNQVHKHRRVPAEPYESSHNMITSSFRKPSIGWPTSRPALRSASLDKEAGDLSVKAPGQLEADEKGLKWTFESAELKEKNNKELPPHYPEFKSRTRGSISGNIPLRIDSVSLSEPLSVTVLDHTHVLLPNRHSPPISPTEIDRVSSVKSYGKSSGTKIATTEYDQLEKDVRELEDDNYWLRKKLAEAEDEIARYRNGDSNVGKYFITGDCLPSSDQKSLNGSDIAPEQHVTGDLFPPRDDDD